MVCGAAEICVSWGRQLLPALPDFGLEHPNSRLRDTSFPPSSLSTLRPPAAALGPFQRWLCWLVVQRVGRAAIRRTLGGAWSHRAPWYMRQSLHDAMGALAAKNGEVG